MNEAVYTVDDYYDGPLAGFADFGGKPHHYRRQFDHAADEYSDIFRLTPIADDVLPFVKEQWDLWLKWQTAFHAKETTIETHPALPQDRQRYEELKQAVGREVAANESRAVRARGKFHPTGDQVDWARLPDDESGPARANAP
jgi:hypothetical protein